jgi:heme-degrading monooxygenase HmoA
LSRLDGHRGAQLLRRDDGGDVALCVLTYWESMEAVKRFAGDDADLAVVEEDARAALTSYDARVAHFEVLIDATPR